MSILTMLVPVKNKPAVPVQLLHRDIDEYGWTNGGIAFYLDPNDPDSLVEYNFEAKVYKVGSNCGINNGKISKLHITNVATNNEIICYERGWGYHARESTDPGVDIALNAVIMAFNN